jgi:ribosomal protein S18 acetylase RimI-like enzyme
MRITVVGGGELTDAGRAELGGFIAARNVDPAQHVGFLGEEAAAVAAELADLDDVVFATARDELGDLAGTVGLEWDADVGRAWVLGPWADSPELMDELYAAADAAVPAGVAEREIFCAATNAGALAFADRHRFGEPIGHVILTFPRSRLAGLAAVTLPTLTPAYADQVAALHGRTFPGTHTPAPALLARPAPIWVVVEGDRLLGYVTLKVRPEFDDAQIDYVAVDESARGRGVGARLVSAALLVAFADERITSMELVTNNPAARRLYERVGFTVLREMCSFRRGAGGARA